MNWIWLRNTQDQPQTTLIARRAFEVREVPDRARLMISASHIYRLHVNGRCVGRGPDRADPRWPYFDEYDVASWLRQGRNTIVCLLHHVRPKRADGRPLDRAWPLYDGPGGFMLRLTVGRQVLITDGDWRLCRAPGWRVHDDPISRFLTYKHDVDLDAAREVDLASKPDYDDAHWDEPMCLQPDDDAVSAPGLPRPRETPMLVPTPRRATVIADVSPQHNTVENRRHYAIDNPTQPLTINPDERGGRLRLDFAHSMGGFPEVAFRAEGGGELDLYYGEGASWVLSDRLRFSRGSHRYTPMDWRGGRHVELHFRNLDAPVVFESARFIDMVYPFEERGEFRCSDPTLNRLWQICKRTLWVATKDHPMDCVAREQALWLSDLTVYTRAAAACFGDLRPVAKAVRQALRTMDAEGVVSEPSPSGVGYDRKGEVLPWSEAPLFIATIVRDYVRHTGDVEFARQTLPDLGRIFAHLGRYRDDRGLLQVSPPGMRALSPFGGWDTTLKDGVPVSLNCIYALNLRRASELAAWSGESALAGQWTQAADALIAAVCRAFWNAGRCVFHDGERDGRKLSAVSWAANIWAAQAGALDPALRGAWADTLWTSPDVFSLYTPFDATNLLDTLTGLDLELYVRDLLGGYFGSIVRADEPTLPEMWWTGVGSGARYGGDTSRCHCYGSGPTYACSGYILGAGPITPGWGQTQIRPHLLGLTSAEGRVPTPLGDLAIRWERDDFHLAGEITLPPGLCAHVELPLPGWGAHELVIDGIRVADRQRWDDYAAQANRTYTPTGPRVLRHVLQTPGRHTVQLNSR